MLFTRWRTRTRDCSAVGPVPKHSPSIHCFIMCGMNIKKPLVLNAGFVPTSLQDIHWHAVIKNTHISRWFCPPPPPPPPPPPESPCCVHNMYTTRGCICNMVYSILYYRIVYRSACYHYKPLTYQACFVPSPLPPFLHPPFHPPQFSCCVHIHVLVLAVHAIIINHSQTYRLGLSPPSSPHPIYHQSNTFCVLISYKVGCCISSVIYFTQSFGLCSYYFYRCSLTSLIPRGRGLIPGGRGLGTKLLTYICPM